MRHTRMLNGLAPSAGAAAPGIHDPGSRRASNSRTDPNSGSTALTGPAYQSARGRPDAGRRESKLLPRRYRPLELELQELVVAVERAADNHRLCVRVAQGELEPIATDSGLITTRTRPIRSEAAEAAELAHPTRPRAPCPGVRRPHRGSQPPNGSGWPYISSGVPTCSTQPHASPRSVGQRERLLLVVGDEQRAGAGRRRMPATSSRRLVRSPASSEANGSSSSTTSGSMASARARATRWRSPPDSSCGYERARSARPTSSRHSSTRPAEACRSRRCRPRSGGGTGRRPGTPCRPDGARARPRCRCRPPPARRSHRPRSGHSNPAITRSSVVLPEPLGPSRATTWPWATPRLAVDGTGGAERLHDVLRGDRENGHVVHQSLDRLPYVLAGVQGP